MEQNRQAGRGRGRGRGRERSSSSDATSQNASHYRYLVTRQSCTLLMYIVNLIILF